jgi:hypothetical protein
MIALSSFTEGAAAAPELPTTMSFSRLVVKHREVCRKAGYNSRGIAAHEKFLWAFLRALDLTGETSCCIIWTKADLDRLTDLALQRLCWSPGTLKANVLRLVMCRVRQTLHLSD